MSDATARIRRRRRGSTRRTVLTAVVGLLVLALVVTGVWLVGFSSAMAVSRVAVTGTTVLSEDQVREAAAVSTGAPLAGVDLDAVEQRVAELPPVSEVRVRRSWPDTITITVTERTPVFAVKQNHGEGHLLVDAEGIAYTEVTEVPDDLLVATAADADLLGDIATVIADLTPKLRRQVTAISAETRDSITLELSKDRTVIWGSAERGDLKASVLEVLLSEKGSVYNVSAPEQPAVR
ncbi:MAG TPA: FtsQ-type POTRA domain-containing protein [Candidatus Avipropionibacterium avicola]|uniref:Cell division protein FtsQ n=1 Tax=Candidatus Avipropionibacterium avicola TaxID=2840701 RepID=A0A9D1GW37_9ACTN|nr:FtsQ-type POTRA domain-containing protein [Candidatus Avipropionibacterium avicola]